VAKGFYSTKYGTWGHTKHDIMHAKTCNHGTKITTVTSPAAPAAWDLLGNTVPTQFAECHTH